MSLALTTLALLSASCPSPASPHCGALMAGILPNCSLVKMLDNTFPEYVQPLPPSLCADNTGGPASGTPHIAQDKGSPWFGGTGNDSYLFYTSGHGKFIHQVYIDKTSAAPVSGLKAQLPAQYSPIIGLQQAAHSAPLLLLTTEALYAAPAGVAPNRAVTLLSPLANLSLGVDAVLTTRAATAGDATLLYVLHGGSLHTITVRHQDPASASVVSIVTARLASSDTPIMLEALPSQDAASISLVTLMQVSTPRPSASAAFRLATFDPAAARPSYTPINVTLPFAARPSFSTLGIGGHLFVAAGGSLISIFLAPPMASGGAWTADVSEPTPFVDGSTVRVLGGVQYFV